MLKATELKTTGHKTIRLKKINTKPTGLRPGKILKRQKN
jgi:hypothetical protein